jgi:4-amino-4-deoxy-L-arabinose transferase-like glycosyltransferase
VGVHFKKYFCEIILLLILIIFTFYSFFDITQPLNLSHHGFITGQYSENARNYLKLGYLKTKLALTRNIGSFETGKEKFEVYVNRPIGLAILMSFIFYLFGIQEWSARLIQVILNFGTIILLYLLVKRHFSKKAAIFSSIFLVFSPMFFYMRNLVATESASIFFILVLIYIYLEWIKNRENRYLYYLLIAFSFSTFIDWTVYFIIPPLLIHFFLFEKKRMRNSKILLLIPLAVLMFSIYVFHIWIAAGEEGLLKLKNIFLFRTNLSKESWEYNITLKGLFNRLLNDFNYFYTPMMLFLTSFFLIKFSFKLKQVKFKNNSLLIMTFLFLLSYLFVFSNSYWIHDFLILILIPVIPIISALAVIDIISYRPSHKTLIKPPYFFIPIILIVFFFYSFNSISKIYKGSTEVWEIINFLASNDGNIIISFDEHPLNFQFKFYIFKNFPNERKVYDVRSYDRFISIITNNSENFQFFITREDSPLTDNTLKNFLNDNFRSKKFGIYNVYYLR